jgi:hypothetical protein
VEGDGVGTTIKYCKTFDAIENNDKDKGRTDVQREMRPSARDSIQRALAWMQLQSHDVTEIMRINGIF